MRAQAGGGCGGSNSDSGAHGLFGRTSGLTSSNGMRGTVARTCVQRGGSPFTHSVLSTAAGTTMRGSQRQAGGRAASCAAAGSTRAAGPRLIKHIGSDLGAGVGELVEGIIQRLAHHLQAPQCQQQHGWHGWHGQTRLHRTDKARQAAVQSCRHLDRPQPLAWYCTDTTTSTNTLSCGEEAQQRTRQPWAVHWRPWCSCMHQHSARLLALGWSPWQLGPTLVLVSHRTSSCWMRRLSPPATRSPRQHHTKLKPAGAPWKVRR